MYKKRVGRIKEQFGLVIHSDETANIEFWFARELLPLLGYERWENFDKAITRAMESCETSYLVVQNGDPKKEEVAFAQSYFAVQIRKQELIEEHRVKSQEKKLAVQAGKLPELEEGGNNDGE